MQPYCDPDRWRAYRTFFCWGRAKTLLDMISRGDNNWFVRSNYHHPLERLKRNDTSPTNWWLNRFERAVVLSAFVRRHPAISFLCSETSSVVSFSQSTQHGPHAPKYRKFLEERHKLSSGRHRWDILGMAKCVQKKFGGLPREKMTLLIRR